jgi:hypothetical protein
MPHTGQTHAVAPPLDPAPSAAAGGATTAEERP